MDLYETLGVARNATAQEIKAAARKLSAKFHPDKVGDDSTRDQFERVRHAASVLLSPDRRKRYDETGDDGGKDPPDPLSPQGRAMVWVGRAIEQAIEQTPESAIEKVSLVETMMNMLRDIARQQTEQQKVVTKRVVKLEKAVKRVKAKNGEDAIARIMADNISRWRATLDQMNQVLGDLKLALEIIGRHEFEVDTTPQQAWDTTGLGGTTTSAYRF